MSDTNMPAAEASTATAPETDQVSYEFAFHVLPTVAEGEVTAVYNDLKELIATRSGEIFDEETPQRFDLAYEIVKHLEGKNRKFSSAYFGWIRFKMEPSAMETLSAEIEAHRQLLRYLIIRLTKVEEAHPFRFHESLDHKQVSTVTEDEVTDTEKNDQAEADTDASKEETVDEGELDEALKKDEA